MDKTFCHDVFFSWLWKNFPMFFVCSLCTIINIDSISFFSQIHRHYHYGGETHTQTESRTRNTKKTTINRFLYLFELWQMELWWCVEQKNSWILFGLFHLECMHKFPPYFTTHTHTLECFRFFFRCWIC